MTRERPFPIQPDTPADDTTLIYKIFTTGFDDSYLVIGETVFLSDEGIEILAPADADFQDQNAYTFRDEDSYQIGGMYGADDTGQNTITILAKDSQSAGDDVVAKVQSLADPTNDATAKSKARLIANRVGETEDTFITITKSDTQSVINLRSTEFTSIKPTIKHIGDNDEVCFTYIKDSYFIIKYNDSGTNRFKYLDLSGTGVTWVHSTTEP